jgi:NADH-quinone oxidoreductase subunit C
MILSAVPDGVVDEIEHRGELTVEVPPGRLVDVAGFVAGPPLAFSMLADLTCADFPDDPRRFRLAYQLFSLENGARLRLRVWAGAEPEVPSVTGVWPTANWHEREVFDMFGVRFAGHPDLTRILMPSDWDGHPLRRDYPLGGEDVEFSDDE